MKKNIWAYFEAAKFSSTTSSTMLSRFDGSFCKEDADSS